MNTIKIVWQRLVDEQGATCDRCDGTEQELDKAVRFLQKALAPGGLRFLLEKKAMNIQEVASDPTQSNRIWINGRPLEKWLGAGVGKSPCRGPCEGMECRTLEQDGTSYETIPAELIIKGGLLAVQHLVHKISGKQA